MILLLRPSPLYSTLWLLNALAKEPCLASPRLALFCAGAGQSGEGHSGVGGDQRASKGLHPDRQGTDPIGNSDTMRHLESRARKQFPPYFDRIESNRILIFNCCPPPRCSIQVYVFCFLLIIVAVMVPSTQEPCKILFASCGLYRVQSNSVSGHVICHCAFLVAIEFPVPI